MTALPMPLTVVVEQGAEGGAPFEALCEQLQLDGGGDSPEAALLMVVDQLVALTGADYAEALPMSVQDGADGVQYVEFADAQENTVRLATESSGTRLRLGYVGAFSPLLSKAQVLAMLPSLLNFVARGRLS